MATIGGGAHPIRWGYMTLGITGMVVVAALTLLAVTAELDAAPVEVERRAEWAQVTAQQAATDTLCCSVDPDTTHYWEAIPVTLTGVHRWKLDCMSSAATTADLRGLAVKMSAADATGDTLDNIWLFASGLQRGGATTGWQRTQVDTFWLRGMSDDDDVMWYSLVIEGQ